MRKLNLNHNPHTNWVSDRVTNWVTNRNGSILIWSVMLGFVLTSVFFFFGMRQRASIGVQRDTVEILNTKAYIESLADYWEANVASIPSDPYDITVDDIRFEATQKTDEIEGAVDAFADPPLEYQYDGEIYVEWNKCSDELKGDLEINDAPYPHDDADECDLLDDGYDDIIGPITVNPSFTIETSNVPFSFNITGNDLVDNKWYFELSTELDYGKKITIKKEFDAP